MRKYIILFALCVFFAGISYYLLTTLNPFDDTAIAQLVQSQQITVTPEFDSVVSDLMSKGLITEFLNIRNVILLTSTALLSLISGFMLVHIVLDKLFFRKFYEQPSLLLAFRRGLFLCLGVVSVFVYKLYAAEWYLAVLTIGLLFIVELVIGRLAPVRPVVEDPEDQAVVAPLLGEDGQPVKSAKHQFKLTMPKFKEWPGKFRETVMQQVTESVSDEDSSEQLDIISELDDDEDETVEL